MSIYDENHQEPREPRLIRNAIQTPDGTVLRSRHRHDFVEYTDASGYEYFVDGGLDYQRIGHGGEFTNLAAYDNEPFEVVRDVFEWGSYGKNGDEKLHYIPLKNMATEHIKAILDGDHCQEWCKWIFEKELEVRDGIY